MKRHFGFFAVLLAGLLGIFAAGLGGSALERNGSTVPAATPGQAPPSWEWPVSTPEEQGLDSKSLAELMTAIREGAQFPRLHCLLIVRHGYLVVMVVVVNGDVQSAADRSKQMSLFYDRILTAVRR